MEIVGIDRGACGEADIETVEVWYSSRRRAWFVERLDVNGDQIGLAHRCFDEEEASACLAEWLRAHEKTHLLAPRPLTPAERRVATKSAARARRAA